MPQHGYCEYGNTEVPQSDLIDWTNFPWDTDFIITLMFICTDDHVGLLQEAYTLFLCIGSEYTHSQT